MRRPSLLAQMLASLVDAAMAAVATVLLGMMIEPTMAEAAIMFLVIFFGLDAEPPQL